MSYTISKGTLKSPVSESTEEEFEAIREAKKLTLEMLVAEEKYDFVIENYLEFEESLLSATLRYMTLGVQDEDWFNKDRNQFDRRIFNFLCASGAYTDFSLHCAGVLSDQQDLLKKEFSRLYDEQFSYRLVRALRDFFVHHGLASHLITYSSNREELPDADEFQLTVDDFYLRYSAPEIEVSGARMAESKKVKKKLLNEIKEHGGKVSLVPILRQYVGHLSQVHVFLRRLCQPRVNSATNLMESVFARFGKAHPDAEPYSALVARRVEDKILVEEFAFVRHPNRLDYFAEKNQNLPNFEKRFISNVFSLRKNEVANIIDSQL